MTVNEYDRFSSIRDRLEKIEGERSNPYIRLSTFELRELFDEIDTLEDQVDELVRKIGHK